ncbi:MAG: hypothetical protein ACRBBP_09015 [Bdellovibrionales bacterium]
MRTKSLRKERYRKEKDKYIVELAVPDYNHLFDGRDPARFRQKDLDDDAVDYIVSSIQEVTLPKLSHIEIYFDQVFSQEEQNIVVDAIHTFFQYESEMMSRKINSTFRKGLKSLFIGIVFLSFAILGSLALKNTDHFLGLFFKEGVLLIGWVSMWKPINIFLYDWWPLADLKKIYDKLSVVRIDFSQKF